MGNGDDTIWLDFECPGKIGSTSSTVGPSGEASVEVSHPSLVLFGEPRFLPFFRGFDK